MVGAMSASVTSRDGQTTPRAGMRALKAITKVRAEFRLNAPWCRKSRLGLLRSRREGTFIYYRADFEQLRVLTDFLWEDCCKRGKGGETCC
ncbi:hypothetical protein [Salmonella enterica]|uniref:hypothetical protein n=1 Tax=Salmonella enterica TaxID=28901 RepID=UPI001CA58AB0|nr:hypothetical protein [Salmonella enterica]